MAEPQSAHKLLGNVSSNLRRRAANRQVAAQGTANSNRQSSSQKLSQQEIRSNNEPQFTSSSTSSVLHETQYSVDRSNMDSFKIQRSRSIIKRARQARLQNASKSVSHASSNTTMHDRQIRFQNQSLASKVQHQVLGKQPSINRRSFAARLAFRSRLRERTIATNNKSFDFNKNSQVQSNSNSSNLVQRVEANFGQNETPDGLFGNLSRSFYARFNITAGIA